eukprot:TRINITY_DN167_c0_g1_i1.p1 TRINITY_DN167_c0_g1~~TRINITY_DN167_c0_g1_i1.p1  ORF type:complete len:275 (+),score=80.44 TRINITY_DN167_c0_g1_i1:118-942(+)
MVYMYEYNGIQDTDVLALIMLLASPVFTFLGIRFVYPVLGLLGLSAGGYGMFLLLNIIKGYTGWVIQPNYEIAAVLISGVVAGVILVKLTRAGIFVLGGAGMLFAGNAAFNFAVSTWITSPVANLETYHIVVMVISAIVGGILAIYFVEKVVVRILSAFVGGYMFVGAFDYGLGRAHAVTITPLAPTIFLQGNPGTFACSAQVHCYVLIVVWLLLFFAGVWVQFKFYKDKNGKYLSGKGPEVVVRHVYDDEDSDDEGERRKRRKHKKKHKKNKH